jgi:HD-like signal output (HDOD) protein
MTIVEDFFAKINQLPMLPKVVQEVSQLLENSEVDVKVLASKIEHDQVLTARVLSMSNAAYYGCARRIKSIEDAVAVIGFKSLSTLVVASGVTRAFVAIPNFDLRHFWKQSLVVASIARQLAKDTKRDAETAYIGGLMHSVGLLPINLVFPAAGAKLEEQNQSLCILDRLDLEENLLGINHSQVGEMLARHWNLPPEIQSLIRYYAAPLNKNASKLAPVVYAAAYIAFYLQSFQPASKIADMFDANVAQVLGLQDKAELSEKIETYQGFIAEAEAYI